MARNLNNLLMNRRVITMDDPNLKRDHSLGGFNRLTLL
jgi:hypothetical protein